VKTSRKNRTAAKRQAAHASASEWTEIAQRGIRIVQARALNAIPWLVHGFSTTPGGVSECEGKKVLNLAFSEWDARENVIENRVRFQAALGAVSHSLVPLKQFHSDLICFFRTPPAEACRGDASATDTPGLLLGIQTADCVPILLVDPKNRAVAAVHAGWRGTLARIAEKTVGHMQMRFGSKPAELLAALGPAIGGCCYEVGAELVTRFTSQFAEADDWFDEPRTGEEPNPLQWLNMAPPGHQPPPKSVRLDLRKANRSQFIAAGLREKNIFVSELCTACRPDLLFSYRMKGPLSGRHMSVIGIRP